MRPTPIQILVIQNTWSRQNFLDLDLYIGKKRTWGVGLTSLKKACRFLSAEIIEHWVWLSSKCFSLSLLYEPKPLSNFIFLLPGHKRSMTPQSASISVLGFSTDFLYCKYISITLFH